MNDWELEKKEFLEKWSLERVKTMSLEEYTGIKNQDTFTYWLEAKTTNTLSIWGGSAYKFGIFKRNPSATLKTLKTGQKSDGEYGWYEKYGNTRDKAFDNIKANILTVIEAAQHQQFKIIDSIDLGDAYKWKLAFMYAPEESLLRFAAKEAFSFLAKKYKLDSATSISQIQNELIKLKSKDEDFYSFSSRLWDEYFENKANEETFYKWLKNEKYLEDSTIKKYINRLKNSIPEQLRSVDGFKNIENLFDVNIDSLLLIQKFLQNGGILYEWNVSTKVKSEASAAIGNYIEYLIDDLNEDHEYVNKSYKDNTSMLKYPLNQILYGPPGTGKTYHVVDRALEILGETYGSREEANEKFDIAKKNGQIEFVTFHQSYGYEEFVEGIKAKTNHTDNVIYEIEDGIFKKHAKNAKIIKSQSKLSNFDWSSNNVFKMSLGGKNDTSILDWCLENNYISMGWGDDVDFSSVVSEKWEPYRDEVKPLLKNRIADKDIRFTTQAMHAFQKWMQKGDLVFISSGNLKIVAIGQVVGDYEFRDDVEELNYFQYRKINWLFVDKIGISVDKLLSKKLSQQTIYNLDKSYIKRDTFDSLFDEQMAATVKPYILIIDEINRGNISKIFGELITLIEPSKRLGAKESIEITLPYSGEVFGVPSNLHIIGTMNTADRSIALMDTALRRRFHFKEMMPDYNTIENITIEGIKIAAFLEKINQRVEYLYDRDHQIGHAYFIDIQSKEELDDTMTSKVIPLLQEYFYDDWEKIQMILGDHNDQKAGNDDKFITSFQQSEIKLFDFNHDDVEDEKMAYSINKTFSRQAYVKLYE